MGEENINLSSVLDMDINTFLAGSPEETSGENNNKQTADLDGNAPGTGEGTDVKPAGSDKKDDTVSVNDILASSLDKAGTEPKEKVIKPEKTGDTPDPQKTNDSSSSLTFSFYQDLLDRGLISKSVNEDEFKKLVEENGGDEYDALMKIQEDELEENRNSIIAELEEDVQTYFKLRDSGLSTEQASKLVATQFQLEKITENDITENADIRKVLMTQYLKKTTSFSDDEIEDTINNKVDTGKDVEFSKSCKDKLIKFGQDEIKEQAAKAEQAKTAKAEQDKQQRVTFAKMLDNIHEVFPDVKLSKVQKQEINDMIMKPVAQDSNGKPVNAVWAEYLKDPMKFQLAVALAIKNGTLYGAKAPVTKAAETKAMSKFKAQIERANASTVGEGIGKVPGFNTNTNGGNIFEVSNEKAEELKALFAK